jgi:antitoxin PrlF
MDSASEQKVKEVLATVTERGQLTLPAEVRRLLGVGPNQKVAFLIEEGEIRLVPARFTLESAFGSIAPRHRPENFKKVIEEAMEEHAHEVMHEMQGQ